MKSANGTEANNNNEKGEVTMMIRALNIEDYENYGYIRKVLPNTCLEIPIHAL